MDGSTAVEQAGLQQTSTTIGSSGYAHIGYCYDSLSRRWVSLGLSMSMTGWIMVLRCSWDCANFLSPGDLDAPPHAGHNTPQRIPPSNTRTTTSNTSHSSPVPSLVRSRLPFPTALPGALGGGGE
ncbi:hypothetical protein NMY22_g1046 [Coprinellus aureogranulatus]|nr:hypothetical protein NMY22_g1046 [Coprinellus aureogranulatus]